MFQDPLNPHLHKPGRTRRSLERRAGEWIYDDGHGSLKLEFSFLTKDNIRL